MEYINKTTQKLPYNYICQILSGMSELLNAKVSSLKHQLKLRMQIQWLNTGKIIKLLPTY